MSIFKCKMCGGTLEINANQTTAVCEYCGTQQTLPKLDDDRRANLYDRANHFRRNNEFDKDMSIYENILNEDGTDAEAYWSLVLCRYGIEYVEDPASHKRVPTVNRAQFTSIFDDDNYKSALQYADGYQKSIYAQEATAINEIQKGILAISQKEAPFDVFICYKETDNNGRRTQDSVLANDLYHQLTAEGFKVFFSRITLEDKLGIAYEPYIFAALISAKVMVVIGTKPEYYNAVWVKNEWSRYLALVKQSGGKKVLIPAYRDMDPYDLPEEFSHLQAQDMSKLGFMQDLIRGIKKLVQDNIPKKATKETVIVNGERVLDRDPENAQAYLGKLLAERLEGERKAEIARAEAEKRAKRNKKIAIITTPIVCAVIAFIIVLNTVIIPKGKYNDAVVLMNAGKTVEAYEALIALDGYKDSAEKASSIFSKYKVEKLKVAEVGAYVSFGAYEQDNNTANGKENIEWLVLDKKDGKVLVISKNALDCQPHNISNTDVTWATCSLRKWLNGTFLSAAFSESEKTMISTVTVSADENPDYSTYPGNATQDKVFLLSIAKANKYFSSDSARQCKATAYAEAQGAYVSSSTGNCWVWLRSPGYIQYNAANVRSDGYFNESGYRVDRSNGAVRPALWIDLNS